MDCPGCGADVTRVLMTRKDTDLSRMRRRRCQACDLAFFTVEVRVPDDAVMWVPRPRGMRRRTGFRNIAFS